jgi:hypothetical protein
VFKKLLRVEVGVLKAVIAKFHAFFVSRAGWFSSSKRFEREKLLRSSRREKNRIYWFSSYFYTGFFISIGIITNHLVAQQNRELKITLW